MQKLASVLDILGLLRSCRWFFRTNARDAASNGADRGEVVAICGSDVAGRRVAVIDDELTIRETVGFALRRSGYEVETWPSGLAAWASWGSSLPDLLVLDIVMPELDGLELCRQVRARDALIPILFLSSRDDEVDRVVGLEIGGDDYLCKPFSMRELLARVKVLFRRTRLATQEEAGGDEEHLRVDALELDLRRYTVRWQGRPVPLTVTEFRVLRALARYPGHVKTRRQLIEAGYPEDEFVSERTIDSHVRRLRRKFEQIDPAFQALDTVHGLGYRIRAAEVSD
jgi:DNA-binding response OmpR family regulator